MNILITECQKYEDAKKEQQISQQIGEALGPTINHQHHTSYNKKYNYITQFKPLNITM